MDSELTFRVTFMSFYIWLFIMRGYYVRKVRRSLKQSCENISFKKSWENALKNEGKLNVRLRTALLPFFFAAIVFYIIYPGWIAKLTISFPLWLHWLGVGLGFISLFFWTWVQHTLGNNWSPTLELRKGHTLVTSGPYHWIRHPMYTALFILMIALAMLTANLLIIILNTIVIIIIYARINKEEAMMIERFNGEYNDYIKRTGRLLPRLIN